MARKIRGGDGATITTSEFDDMSAMDQQEWMEQHDIPLSHYGSLARYASGVPAIYNHIEAYLPDLMEED